MMPPSTALPALLEAHFNLLGDLQGDVSGVIKPNTDLVANLKTCGLTKVLAILKVN